MDIFPNGFLHRVHVLVTPAPEILQECADATDHCSPDAGDLLVLPDRSEAFVGLPSMGEATLGLVAEVDGAELLTRLNGLARLLGDSSGALEAELLRQCLSLSWCLQRLAQPGDIVRVGRDEAQGVIYLRTHAGGQMAVQSA